MGMLTITNQIFNIHDVRFVKVLRELANCKIEFWVRTVKHRECHDVLIMVDDTRLSETQCIVDKVYGTDEIVHAPEGVQHIVVQETQQDWIEIGPAGNRFKMYGDADDTEVFKEKIDAMIQLHKYANDEYVRVMEKHRNASKGRNHWK